MDYDFVKAYYARVSDRLHGRVTRLLLTPLLAAFTRLVGQDPYIRYLSSFRYALSGEFAIKSDLAERMRLPCEWGLEHPAVVAISEAARRRLFGQRVLESAPKRWAPWRRAACASASCAGGRTPSPTRSSRRSTPSARA
jgi:hypothetical protein